MRIGTSVLRSSERFVFLQELKLQFQLLVITRLSRFETVMPVQKFTILLSQWHMVLLAGNGRLFVVFIFFELIVEQQLFFCTLLHDIALEHHMGADSLSSSELHEWMQFPGNEQLLAVSDRRKLHAKRNVYSTCCRMHSCKRNGR
ncbi:hypothetical protein EXS65_01640 [Candidatus Peribacteria bacterium]|nr:hypothetical protein [Candidatus Peribacteria bacterium]